MSNNIILIWPPWSWKTTLAKILSEKLSVLSFDIDDDHLEKVWRKSVWEKLKEVWDEEFVKLEWEAMFWLQKENTIIALTWSNPLHKEAMDHIKSLWTLVFINVDNDLILKRLHEMKVDRIVWMWTSSLEDILKFRNTFYEKYYDKRVMFIRNWEIDQKADKIIREINLSQKYSTTRWEENLENWKVYTFLEVVAKWLADNWWLFIPENFPLIDDRDLTVLLRDDYQTRALKILEKFPIWDLRPQVLKDLISESYNTSYFSDQNIIPTTCLNDKQFLIEIFHGPTAAFKDAALQLTPKFFSEAIKESWKKYLILAATSWDTWIAAIEGYKKEKNVSVMVLFPKNWVSEVQKMQMLSATWDNVFVLWVDWDFDFCQSTVKTIFNDKVLAKELLDKYNTRLSSANSINWWRLMPQVVYHISSYLDLVSMWKIELWDSVDLSIPCWNFWNLLAAFIAWKMWIPFRNYISASNENNVLTDFVNNWIYDLRWRNIKQTHSPSCDILKASNIERLVYILSWGDWELVSGYMRALEEDRYFEVNNEIKSSLKKYFKAWFCSNEDSLKVVKDTLDETWILIDTHTAVAKKVADEFQTEVPMLISSTAHWAKFPDSILKALWSTWDWKGVWEMYKEILSLAPGASVHPMLEEIDQKEIIHNRVCRADIWEIVGEMKEFLDDKTVIPAKAGIC